MVWTAAKMTPYILRTDNAVYKSLQITDRSRSGVSSMANHVEKGPIDRLSVVTRKAPTGAPKAAPHDGKAFCTKTRSGQQRSKFVHPVQF